MKRKIIPLSVIEKDYGKMIEQDDGGCINWIGAKNSDGYGILCTNGPHRYYLAHRVFYAKKHKIEENMVIDHICRNKSCVNFLHLRQVSLKENTTENSNSYSARNKGKTHCKNGHELPEKGNRSCEPNRRRCITCYRTTMRIAQRKFKEKR